MKASLKNGPTYFHLLVFMLLYNTSHIESKLIYGVTEYGGSDGMCCLKLVYKRHWLLILFLGLPIWGKPFSPLKQTKRNTHTAMNQSLLPIVMWGSHLEVDSSATVKPSDDCTPHWHLDCSLMRVSELEHLVKLLLIPDHRNCARK